MFLVGEDTKGEKEVEKEDDDGKNGTGPSDRDFLTLSPVKWVWDKAVFLVENLVNEPPALSALRFNSDCYQQHRQH